MSDLTAEVRAALAKATPGPWRSVVMKLTDDLRTARATY